MDFRLVNTKALYAINFTFIIKPHLKSWMLHNIQLKNHFKQKFSNTKQNWAEQTEITKCKPLELYKKFSRVFRQNIVMVVLRFIINMQSSFNGLL